MLKSLVLSGLLASGLGAFASVPFDNQPLYSPSTQAVIYDDEQYTITLSTDELNNYVYNNLETFLLNNISPESDWRQDIVNIEITYDTITYAYDDFYIEDDIVGLTFIYADDSIQFFNKLFYYYVQDTRESFSTDLTMHLNDVNFYNAFKSSIVLDIQANQPQPSAGFISALFSFVTLLTSGIVTLATGIASGVVGMAKALFLNSTATGLSIFGGLIAMFAGIALAVTLTTKVYQWITSLGN